MSARPTQAEKDQRQWTVVQLRLPAEVAANLRRALWIARAMGAGSETEAVDLLAGEFVGTYMAEYEQTKARALEGTDYDRTRLYVLERDNWTCQDCGRLGRPMHVHHRIKRSKLAGSKQREMRDHPDNLESLCHKCHAEEHNQ